MTTYCCFSAHLVSRVSTNVSAVCPPFMAPVSSLTAPLWVFYQPATGLAIFPFLPSWPCTRVPCYALSTLLFVLSPSALNINIIFMSQVQPCTTLLLPSSFLKSPACISSSVHRTSCEASCPLGAGLRWRHREAPLDPGLTPSIPWEDVTDPETGTRTRQFGVVGGKSRSLPWGIIDPS